MPTVTEHERCYRGIAGEPSAPGNFYSLKDNISLRGPGMQPSSQGHLLKVRGTEKRADATPTSMWWGEASKCQQRQLFFSSISTRAPEMRGERTGLPAPGNVADATGFIAEAL